MCNTLYTDKIILLIKLAIKILSLDILVVWLPQSLITSTLVLTVIPLPAVSNCSCDKFFTIRKNACSCLAGQVVTDSYGRNPLDILGKKV